MIKVSSKTGFFFWEILGFYVFTLASFYLFEGSRSNAITEDGG